MKLTPFPILQTERLTLRPLSLQDCDAIFELRSSPLINKHLNRTICTSIEEAKDFIHKINNSIANGENYYWGISFLNTKELLGTVCLYDFSKEENCCEIGFELRTKFQHQGIMIEAVKSVINFAFDDLKLSTMEAYTHPNNSESIKLLQKLHFILNNKNNTDLNHYRLKK